VVNYARALQVYPWAWADTADESDPETEPGRGPNNEYPQLYTLDAVAYV
jgi:hypothetical protein